MKDLKLDIQYWNCSKLRKGYSGTAVLINSRRLKTLPIEVTEGINHEEHDKEGRSITLEFENFFLVSVYVPNAGEGQKRLNYRVEEFDKAFHKYCKDLE